VVAEAKAANLLSSQTSSLLSKSPAEAASMTLNVDEDPLLRDELPFPQKH
jgi:hypothetical protein